MNTRTDGYFTLNENGNIVDPVYGKLKSGEATCKCCGRKVTNFFETYYIDENDKEICGTYGTECFKKIANWDESVIAI